MPNDFQTDYSLKLVTFDDFHRFFMTLDRIHYHEATQMMYVNNVMGAQSWIIPNSVEIDVLFEHQYCSFRILRQALVNITTIANLFNRRRRPYELVRRAFGRHWVKQIRFNTAASQIQRGWRAWRKERAASYLQAYVAHWLWKPNGPMAKHVKSEWKTSISLIESRS